MLNISLYHFQVFHINLIVYIVRYQFPICISSYYPMLQTESRFHKLLPSNSIGCMYDELYTILFPYSRKLLFVSSVVVWERIRFVLAQTTAQHHENVCDKANQKIMVQTEMLLTLSFKLGCGFYFGKWLGDLKYVTK